MIMKTAQDYHENTSDHGSYQYVELQKIVDQIVMHAGDDNHLLKNVKRYRVLDAAKEEIRKLNLESFSDARAIEITVPENLSYELPHNYVDYLRCSVVVHDEIHDTYRLKTLDMNNNMNIADGYLQDHNYALLFDDQGQILTADSSNIYNKPHKRYEFDPSSVTGDPMLDTSKLSKYGEFVIDRRNGRIGFSSDLADKEIVLEYISDGLQYDTYGEESIKIHKYFLPVLRQGIFYSLIEHLNIPQNQKNAALNRYKTLRHQAKKKAANFDLVKIARALRTSTLNP